MFSEETLKTILIVVVVMFIYNKISSTREGYSRRYASLPGANNMVLTDEKGNLSSIQFPKRMIMIWAGELSKIPDGWALCNGDNETPDLRSKFVIGVNPNTKKNGYGVKEMNNEGGADKIETRHLPAHTHGYSDVYILENEGHTKSNTGDTYTKIEGDDRMWGNRGSADWDNSAMGKNRNTSSVGENQEFLPPYYALAYIMKIV